MNARDAITLTRELLAVNTVNPPGNEAACARDLAGALEANGFAVTLHEFTPARANLIARAGEQTRPLVFTGHLDTVPLGASHWSRDPFAGETDGDALYGRGTSDMKSGVAAMVVAAGRLRARVAASGHGVALVLTAAEEGGCVGSRELLKVPQVLGAAGALVVGEPSSNYPYLGHKGTLKFWAHYRGIAAHGSMPHLGENALYKAACAACRLADYRFSVARHAIMGAPSLNVGMLHSGDTINSVPDEARMGVDIRTVAGTDHAKVLAEVKKLLGDVDRLDVFQNTAAVWTEPGEDWVRRVFAICADTLGEQPVPRSMAYNTDAGNLREAWSNVPAVILGPGEAALAHQTDEHCSLRRIEEAVAIYERLIVDWCKL